MRANLRMKSDSGSFKADLDAWIIHRGARRHRIKLKGPAPDEFRSRSAAAQSLSKPSRF